MTRLAGKAFLAAGFVLAVYGVTEGEPTATRCGLGLVLVGIAAMGYALYRAILARGAERNR